MPHVPLRAPRRLRRPAAALLALAAVACAESGPDVVWCGGSTMGTAWNVSVTRPSDRSAARTEAEVTASVQEVLDTLEAAASTWRPESELSRFNRASLGPDEWFPVSRSTAEVVDRALHWWRESGGAFDVTVGPLVRAWGFGAEEVPERPSDEAVDALRERCGSDGLHCRLEPPALRKARPGLEVDLSAIAKGDAADRVAHRLRERGIPGALVEVGGEIVCFGEKPGGQPWTVGIEVPTPDVRRVDRTLPLRDLAIATSGDYRNFLIRGGVRDSHTLDPRTGRPVRHELHSVSVVGPSCGDADAQCTAIMALGPEQGYAWAVEQGLAARLVVGEADARQVRNTPEFVRLFGEGD